MHVVKTRDEALEYFRRQGGSYDLDDNIDNDGFYFKYEIRRGDDGKAELVLIFDEPNGGKDGLSGINYEYRFGLLEA